LIITREIETRQGVQIKTEYYAADPSRRSASGSAEEQRGNPMRKDISDSIAAFGDKYAMDDRELLTEHELSSSKNSFRRVGFGPDGVNGIGVHYLVRPITPDSYPESIVVKVITASEPYPITAFQTWMMSKPIECEQVLTDDGVHVHKRGAFLRFKSETTTEQRMARAPLDLGPNDSTLALRGGLDQPFSENQVGSSRAHHAQSFLTPNLVLNLLDGNEQAEQDAARQRAHSDLSLDEDGLPNQAGSSREVRTLSDPLPGFFEEKEEGGRLPEGEQRDRALSLLSPYFMTMLCPDNGQQSEPTQGFVDWLYTEFPVDDEENEKDVGGEF
jgi:hypothetical protein